MEQFLHRYILTGLFVCMVSGGLPAIASADATVSTSVPAVAAPTDGADLAMWNASPSASEATDVAPSGVSHILHLQKFAGGLAARSAVMASSLTHNAMRFLGVRYVFGGTSTRGFDCSGYVQHVFATIGVRLPRMADEQFSAGKRVAGKPRAGDLVFFHTYAPGVSHVGISLGDGRFVHASNHGVHVTSLDDSYYAPRYLGAKRVVN
jgi:cell wall-associated NlpC family hydrolase